MNQEKKVEDTTKIVASIVEDVAKAEAKAAAVNDTTKVTDTAKATKTAPKAQKKTAAPKVQKPAETKTETKSNTKETKMAKKSTKKPATPAKAKSNGAGGKRISEDAVLRVSKGFKNPYPEGSGPFKRFEICAKSAGKTYGALRAMASLKPTTALNFVRAGGGHFEGK